MVIQGKEINEGYAFFSLMVVRGRGFGFKGPHRDVKVSAICV